MMCDDGRFAKHACFCFFALNTEMRWHAIQTGWKQNPGDAQLSLDGLCDITQRGDSFSNHVLHYGINHHGTKQYTDVSKEAA